MIACPKCGGETSVVETRDAPSGARRRRRCDSGTCDGRVTTIELPIGEHAKGRADLVLVSRKVLEDAHAALGSALGGGA